MSSPEKQHLLGELKFLRQQLSTLSEKAVITRMSTESRIKTLEERLKKSLYEYRAYTPSKQAVDNAIYIIDVLGSQVIPEIFPTSNWTIAFSWDTQEIEAYLEVGNTRYSGYVQTKNDNPVFIGGNISGLDADLLQSA
jgi:hypothetical protein